MIKVGHRTLSTVAAVSLAAGLVLSGGAAAFAKGPNGHGGGPPTTGGPSGSVTCRVNAALDFSPALQASATGTSAVTLHAQLVGCNASGLHGRTTGHVGASIGTIATNACSAPSSAPSFSGVAIRWTPPKRVPGSTASDASSGGISTLADGDVQVSYSGVGVSGSFATTAGTLTLVSRDSAANLGAACSGAGLGAITFGGSATL